MTLRRILTVTVAALLLAGPITPAKAATSGVLAVRVTGTYAAGPTIDLTGATVQAENLDTGALVPVSAFGTSGKAPSYQAYDVPFGRYRIRISRPDFVTQWWPRQYSADSAAVVTFGDTPGCDPSAATSCDLHILSAELSQAISLTGTIRNRAGAGVPLAQVIAERVDETTYRATTTTDTRGAYALSVPAGQYRLRTRNGGTWAEQTVNVSQAAARDLLVLDPPGPPGSVAAVAGNGTARVTWQRPEDDGGHPVTGYTVIAQPGGVVCRTVSTECLVGDLDNGVDYRFTVQAENAVGTGPAAAAATTVRPASGLVPAPRNVRVTAGTGSIEVTWSASAGPEVVEYLATTRPGGRSCSTTDLHCTITGVRNGNPYTVTVRAITRGAVSEESAPSREVVPGGVPGTPQSISVSPRRSGLSVKWQAPYDDGGLPITEYVATAWPGGATCRTSSGLTCRIRGLDPRVAYSVTLRAANSAGIGGSSPGSSPRKPRPGHPHSWRVRGIEARVEGGRTVVTWTSVTGSRGYWVRVRGVSGRPGIWSMTTTNSAVFQGRGEDCVIEVRAATPTGKGPATRYRMT